MSEETHSLWIEKYRPQTFDEVKGHTAIVERLRAFVAQKNIPHILLAGPAGVGKTTIALIITKTLFGENWRQNTLETNASDERGIDVVREKIKDFARTKAMGTDLPKIIYLDECDSLTKEAQQALRRTMEQYSRSARFILSCNYSSKIIDPVQSRCTVFRFKPLEKHELIDIIKSVAKKENLVLDEKALDAIATISEGDVRKAENVLQSCSAMGKHITEKTIYEIVSAARPEEVLDVLETALKKNFIQARDKLLSTMLRHGLSGIDIIKQIQKEAWNLKVSDESKVAIVEKCGETEFRMVEGSDEFVQLESLLASISLLQ
ncbi:MAG: replication factor C small subunit [Nanoarchaeota archaeon]